jgi:hypothetical protein
VLKTKAEDWSDLITTLSSNTIPRLDHMLQLSIKRRWSPQAIGDSLVNALSKTYHALKQYSPHKISAGLLSYCIGGSWLTFVLSKAFGTPSLQTLKASLLGIVIKPCLRVPDNATMCENLVSVVQRLYNKLPQVLCHLAMDESTLVACAMYMRLHNSIVGICSCAPKSTKLVFDKYKDAEHLRDQLQPPDGSAPWIHFATQATVAVVTIHNHW